MYFEDEPYLKRDEIKAIDLARCKAEAKGETPVPAMPKAQYINYTPPAIVLNRD